MKPLLFMFYFGDVEKVCERVVHKSSSTASPALRRKANALMEPFMFILYFGCIENVCGRVVLKSRSTARKLFEEKLYKKRPALRQVPLYVGKQTPS